MKLSVAALVRCVLFSLLILGSSSANNNSNQHLRSVTAVASEDIASAREDTTVLGVPRLLKKKKAKGGSVKQSKAPKSTKKPKALKSSKKPKGPKSGKVPKSAKVSATASPTAQPSTSQPSPQPSSPPTVDPCADIVTQNDALLALKAGITVDPTSALGNWLDGTDPCTDSWTGITCISGEVTQIVVTSKSLEGTITPLLGCPTTLTSSLGVFVFSNNQLDGSIPTEFGQFTNLNALVFTGNLFSGTIPTELGQLTNLTALTVFQTEVTGTMPTEICALRPPGGSLGTLEADHCGFTSTEVVCTCCTNSC